jgi:hypothetical protein
MIVPVLSAAGQFQYSEDSDKLFCLTLAKYADSELISWGNNYFLNLEQDNELTRAHLRWCERAEAVRPPPTRLAMRFGLLRRWI